MLETGLSFPATGGTLALPTTLSDPSGSVDLFHTQLQPISFRVRPCQVELGLRKETHTRL